MPKFNFENLHRNSKWAFADGFACGILTAVIAYKINKQRLEEKAFRRNALEAKAASQTETKN